MAHGFPEGLLFAIAENPAASEAFRAMGSDHKYTARILFLLRTGLELQSFEEKKKRPLPLKRKGPLILYAYAAYRLSTTFCAHSTAALTSASVGMPFLKRELFTRTVCTSGTM